MTGVHEQSYLAHLAAYAGCLRRETLGCPTSAANGKVISIVLIITWMIAVFIIFVGYIDMSDDFPDKFAFAVAPPSSADLVAFTERS